MTRGIVGAVLLVLLALPATADTQVGQTNTSSTKLYGFTMRADGPGLMVTLLTGAGFMAFGAGGR